MEEGKMQVKSVMGRKLGRKKAVGLADDHTGYTRGNRTLSL